MIQFINRKNHEINQITPDWLEKITVVSDANFNIEHLLQNTHKL